MLAISGDSKMPESIVTESQDPTSRPVDIPLNNKQLCINENKTRILSTISNDLSFKEKVDKLINCMKIKQEKKNQLKRDNEEKSKYENTGTSFKNRYKAQKSIIDMQKTKLMEQEKIISELKMGIITNEDSRRSDKYEISELFHDCKMRLIGKVPLDYIPINQGLHVKPQKAPKIIQELEKRAIERMKYREIIKERKKKLEDEKREHQRACKRQMEEEEKLKHLEMLKERHKQEQEKMKIRQINKERFLKNLNRAILFHEKNLLKKIFFRWKSFYISFLNNRKMSEEYNKRKTLEKYFKILMNIVNCKNSLKCNIADGFHKKLLVKKSWRILRENRMDGVRSWQVAEDYNDFLIQKNVLRCLFSFTSREKILRDIKTQQACLHFHRKLIFYSFFHWKSLPIVLKMEKVKEERKQKWRKKVLEILPDFNPTEVCNM